MSYCKSQSCINDENIFIKKFNEIIDDRYHIIQELFYGINNLPYSVRTLFNNSKIKIFIIRFFNKIHEDYKNNFHKLTQEQKNYFRECIDDKWNKKFNILLDNILIELEDSESNLREINNIMSKINCFYKAYKKHTIYLN